MYPYRFRPATAVANRPCEFVLLALPLPRGKTASDNIYRRT